jgi:hypothetical protein
VFDIENPPTSYRKFRKNILSTIENAEVDEDEEYDVALFLVSRDNEGDIISPQTIIDELAEEVDSDLPEAILPESFIVENIFPNRIKDFNSKFFAIVFQATHLDEDDEEFQVVICLLGSGPTAQNFVGDIDLLKAQIYEEDGELGLDPWQPVALDVFSSLVIPYRRAICPQG